VIGEIHISPSDTPLAGESVTLSIDATSPDGLALRYEWDFGDGTAFGTAASVTHQYAASGPYVVVVTVSDGSNEQTDNTLIEVLDPPPPDAPPGVDSGAAVTNPDNGLGVTVLQSLGGFVMLNLTFTPSGAAPAAVAREDFMFRTDWGQPAPKGPTATQGSQPRRVFTAEEEGIHVVTATAEAATGSVAGKVRKTIVVPAVDLGLPVTIDPPAVDKRAPLVGKFKGRFNFQKLTNNDIVNLSYIITLPDRFQPAAARDITLAVGNVKETVTLDAKGRGEGAAYFKRVQVKYPRLPRGVTETSGGMTAVVKLQMKAPALSAAGFDTEGITDKAGTADAVSRNIQVAMLMEGVGYAAAANVEYKLAKNGSTGALKLPSRN
jgi:PKD repeat protein